MSKLTIMICLFVVLAVATSSPLLEEATTGESTVVIIAGGNNGVWTSFVRQVQVLFKSCEVDNIPDDRNSGGSLLVTAGDRKLLYCGGYSYSDQCYALEATHWIKHSSLTASRAWSRSITMPGGAYILGGNQDTSDFLAASTDTWQPGPRLPHDFRAGCAVRINEEEFVIIGGEEGSGASPVSHKKVTSYNTMTETWTPHTDLNEKRGYHACAFHPPTNSIIVTGGRINSSDGLSSTEIIDVDTWISRKAGDLKQGRYTHAMVTVGGESPTVYAMGGYGNSSDLSSVEEWDPVKEEWKVAQVSLNRARTDFAVLAITDRQC